MKVGDLVTDPGHNKPGTGIILCVRECMVQGELTGALSIETYWPELEDDKLGPIRRNNTHEPWFQYDVISDNGVRCA